MKTKENKGKHRKTKKAKENQRKQRTKKKQVVVILCFLFKNVDSKNLVFLRFIWTLEGLEMSGRPVATFPPILVPICPEGAELGPKN